MPPTGNKKMASEDRLANFVARHGFQGIISPSGKDIHRMCACGKATASLIQPECVLCEKASGKWQGGKRKRNYEKAGLVAGKPQRVPQVSYHAPPAEPRRYPQCRTKECNQMAKHRGTLCGKCYLAADPETRACPACKKAPRSAKCQSGVCHSCVVKIARAANRLWEVSGQHMTLACTALAHEGMDADAHASNQLLEALQMDKLSPEDMEVAVFDLEG